MKISYDKALDFKLEGEYIKAFEIINELELSGISSSSENLNILQAEIFMKLGEETKNLYKKVTFFMAAIESYSINNAHECVYPLFNMAELLGSSSFYKRFLKTANLFLKRIESILKSEESGKTDHLVYAFLDEEQRKLHALIAVAEKRIADHVEPVPVGEVKPEVIVSVKNEEIAERLRPHWEGSSEDTKQEFMKVDTDEFRGYVLKAFKKEGKDALEQVLGHVKKNERWLFWLCRTCSQKFATSEECTSHLEQVHDPKFRPSSTNDLAEKVTATWSDKISVGVWKPVDAEAAVEMIKNDVKAFKLCKEWPLAEDGERSELLNGIQSLLVTLSKHKILSQGIRDMMKRDVVKRLEQLKLSGQTITDSGLLQTPMSICFLKSPELSHILHLLSSIKCNREDAIDMVCLAVASLCGGTRVKEKIDFDSNFAFMLLDKRLLQGNVGNRFDEGKISFIDPTVHCTKTQARGDGLLSWLTVSSSSGDERFRFPRSIKAQSLDLWVAALKSFQFVCRTLKTKHEKKMELLGYGSALKEVKELCLRRKPIQEGQQKGLASLLYSASQENGVKELFLCAVADVLKSKQVKIPTLKLTSSVTKPVEGCHTDDNVMKSLQTLENLVTIKVNKMDAKALLLVNSRFTLLQHLTMMCVFDFRSYIHPPLKQYVLDCMERSFRDE